MKNLKTRIDKALAVASPAHLMGNRISGMPKLQAFTGACMLVSSFVVVWDLVLKAGWKICFKL